MTIENIQIDFPWQIDVDETQKVINHFNFLLKNNKKIIFNTQEINDYFIDFVKSNDYKNITYNISTILHFKLENAEVNYNFRKFEYFSNFYKKNRKILEKLKYTDQKPFYFDALLGIIYKRKNKLFVKNFLEKNMDKNDYYMKHFDYKNNTDVTLDFNNNSNNEFDIGFSLENINSEKKVIYRNEIEYYGEKIAVVGIVPDIIYNKCMYSIVADTCYRNDFSYYTEKLIKPILAKRLFVVFNNKYYLKNFKTFGFKTFDDIIDESYDNIDDDLLRWKKASEQILFLKNKNKLEILQKIEPIVNYNLNHLFNNF